MDISLKEVLQYAVIIPVGYLWHRVEAIAKELSSHKDDTYSKDETKEQISLRLQVIYSKLDTIQDDLKYIRKSLEEDN